MPSSVQMAAFMNRWLAPTVGVMERSMLSYYGEYKPNIWKVFFT